MGNLFEGPHWTMAYEFLTAGDPPLVTQMLVLNTVVLIFWMVRRMRGASAMRYQTANMVQGLLIFANCMVLLNGDFKFFDVSRFMNIFS